MRFPLLDVVRGFSLFGIFLMNLASFSGFTFMSPAQMAALPTSAVDGPIGLVMLWLAYGKFYSLFSLLFGIGFALQIDAAERRGDRGLHVFRKRLLVLLGIGLVHMYVWEGDIVALYAVVGFLLVPFRRLSQRALLASAAVLLVLPVVQQALIVATGGAADPGAPLLALGERHLVSLGYPPDTTPYPLLKHAGWREFATFQLTGFWFRYADLLTSGRPFKVLAMFLLGLWVGRSGLLQDLAPWTPVLRRVRFWSLVVGGPAALAQVVLLISGIPGRSPLSIVEAAAYALGIAPMALAYASHLALLWQSPRWNDRLIRLMPAGRMALTIYLSQTVVGVALFYGIGLGLMGEVGPALWLPLTAIVVGAQAAAAWWWLGRYRQGPMEWLWRRVAYGQVRA